MIFPALCPLCHADSGRRVIPSSPEVETFRCGHCRHEWSEPVQPFLTTATDAPIPEQRWKEALLASR